jgi:hypothetical protein
LITRHGIGSGVWLLFVVPALAELPGRVGAIGGLLAGASISATAVLAWAAFVVIAVAAITGIVGTKRPAENAAANCLWPVLLSYAVLPWLLVTIDLAATGGNPISAAWLEPGSSPRIAMLAGLLGLFVYLYARLGTTINPTGPGAPQAIVWIVLTAITVVGEVLLKHFGQALPLDAELLIVSTLVASVILAAWRSPQPEESQSSGVK